MFVTSDLTKRAVVKSLKHFFYLDQIKHKICKIKTLLQQLKSAASTPSIDITKTITTTTITANTGTATATTTTTTTSTTPTTPTAGNTTVIFLLSIYFGIVGK